MSAIDQYLNTPEIQQAQSNYDTAVASAQKQGASMSGLPEKLRQAILEKFNYNKDLIEQRNKAAADYFATPATDRLKYASIGNPMMTEKLVAQDKAAMYQPWANLTDILAQRTGRIDEIAKSLYDTAQTDYEASKFGAETARQKLADLLDIGKTRANYDLEVTKMNRSGGGIGSAAYKQSQIMAAQADAARGAELRPLIQKYTPLGLSPDDIYSIYNQYNYGTNGKAFQPGKGGYGAPKETQADLLGLGVNASSMQKDAQIQQARVEIAQDISAANDPGSANSPNEDTKKFYNAVQKKPTVIAGIKIGGGGVDKVALFNKLKEAYPELSQTEIISIMKANGLDPTAVE